MATATANGSTTRRLGDPQRASQRVAARGASSRSRRPSSSGESTSNRPAVAEMRLALDAAGPHDGEPLGQHGRPPAQPALADPGRPDDDQRPAPTLAHRHHELLQPADLAPAAHVKANLNGREPLTQGSRRRPGILTACASKTTATRSSTRSWRRDSARARRVVEEALATGAPVPDVYLGVLEPALREVGHRWAMGALNVAEEHYATAVAQSILDALSRQLPRAPRDGRLAVVTGSPEEQHVLGARMVADFLEADGWEVLLLGPGAPAGDLVALVESEQPDLVALSTATAGVLDGVAEVLGALGSAAPAAVRRRRRPVLDHGHARSGARARRRPRRPRPARARRAAARADPAADMRIRDGGPADAQVGARPARRGRRLAGRARPDRPVGHGAVLGRSNAGSRRCANGPSGDGLRIAEADGEPVGALVLGVAPAMGRAARPPGALRRGAGHLTPARRRGHRRRADPARDRRDARGRDLALLRVDCWAGAPPLVAWYERQGFTRSGTFVVLDGWHGQVFSMAVE